MQRSWVHVWYELRDWLCYMRPLFDSSRYPTLGTHKINTYMYTLTSGSFWKVKCCQRRVSYRISLFLEKILGYFRYMKLRIYKCTMYHWLYVWEMTLQLQFQNVGMILIKMKLLTFMILSHKCSIVFVKVLNTFIRQGFSQVLKARKLSDLCFKRKNCQHLTNWTTCNKRDEV